MTETITARRVWAGDTRSGIERYDLIGYRADGRVFKGSTLSAWVASLWKQACPSREALTVTWDWSADARYKNVQHVELPRKAATA